MERGCWWTAYGRAALARRKDIAPSDELRRWFGHDPARFNEFSRRYRAELAANNDAVGRIEDLVKAGPVTLLYAAHDEAHNNARVLADYLKARALGGQERP
jgi:uncharacterized protein YeaO (DUF488 family)